MTNSIDHRVEWSLLAEDPRAKKIYDYPLEWEPWIQQALRRIDRHIVERIADDTMYAVESRIDSVFFMMLYRNEL